MKKAFTRRNKYIIVTLFLVLSLSMWVFYYRQTSARPNILLITIDALRADHLGCYGYARDTSPNIDRLAEEGVRFTQAISQSTTTVPSVPSFMTSLYPSQLGINSILEMVSIPAVTLAEILKENHYATGLIVAHILEHTSIKKGFESAVFISPLESAYTSDKVTRKALDWIHQNRNKRFFLWLHYMDPHEPFTPPRSHGELFLSEKLKEKGEGVLKKEYYWLAPPQNPSSLLSVTRVTLPRGLPVTIQTIRGNLNEEDKGYYVAQYDGEIRFTDEQIGILLDGLGKLGLKKRTAVIVSADHGETLAEVDDYFTHGTDLKDNQIKVPLIITYRTLPGHQIIKKQVRLIDIMPTILDIAGIKKGLAIEGKSLLPLIFGKEDASERYAFSELFGAVNAKSVRTEDWKLISYSDKNREELYNLKNDPGERNNLAWSKSEELESLRRILNTWIGGLKQRGAHPSRALQDDVKEKLRALGYAQ